MSTMQAKWKHIELRLAGWAGTLVEGLTQAEQRQAWLACKALLRRPSNRPLNSPPLTMECAFEAAVERLRAARAGDESSAQALERLVRDGYVLDREESLAGFAADLDEALRLEVAALACFAYRQRGEPPREAISRALRLAYDRDHASDEAARQLSARTLSAVLDQVRASPVLRSAVEGFAADHMRSLDGPPG
jgi:hypothetical protein